MGYRVTEIAVADRPRRAGRAKYGLPRVGAAAVDLCAVRWIQQRYRDTQPEYDSALDCARPRAGAAPPQPSR